MKHQILLQLLFEDHQNDHVAFVAQTCISEILINRSRIKSFKLYLLQDDLFESKAIRLDFEMSTLFCIAETF